VSLPKSSTNRAVFLAPIEPAAAGERTLAAGEGDSYWC